MVIAVGDFNAVLDNRLDSFPPGSSGGRVSEGRLAQFLEEIGWCDLWRARNPNDQQYSCFSGSHHTLSRIDLAIGNQEVQPLIGKIEYRPRGVSDHSPLIVTITARDSNIQRTWSLNPIWLEIIGNRDEIIARLGEFIQHNRYQR